MQHFIWQPGLGVDPEALARIRACFHCPKTPMGEAWFMGERRLFPELQGDLAGLTTLQLQEALDEISSGTSCFGPLDEWRDWYHYLLGEIVHRSHESFVSSLLESLVTGFMALYPNGVSMAPYPEFRQDALLTLGRTMMDPNCWAGDEIVVGSFLHRSNNNPNKIWCWWEASGDFSASLFFCLKYLPESKIPAWYSSVLAIKSPHWRAQMLVWLVGAHDILQGKINWPSELLIEAHPSVSWAWSNCLKPELAISDESGATPVAALLSDTARTQALDSTYAYFTTNVFREWLDSISSVPYLESELGAIPTTFEHLYVGRDKPDDSMEPKPLRGSA